MYLYACQHCKTDYSTKDYRSKFCSPSCSSKSRNGKILSKNEEKYLENPRLCLRCNNPISYTKKKDGNKYCSRSCAASVNNKGRIPSDEHRKKISDFRKAQVKVRTYTSIWFKNCLICGLEFAVTNNKAKRTCSSECARTLHQHSSRNNPKCGGSTKQYIQYKGVSLDSSWEYKVALSLDEYDIRWERPSYFKLSDGRRYTPDFFLPQFKIYLDPKAYRKGYLQQVAKIRQFEEEYDTRCIILAKKQLSWPAIQMLLE